MNKQERVNYHKQQLRAGMVQAIFEPLVRQHLPAMERSDELGALFPHSEHVWEISRMKSIWVIECKGLYDWSVQFDTGWFTGPAGDRYEGIDTFVFKENPIADTKQHLMMAIEFVSHYLATTNPDGTVKI